MTIFLIQVIYFIISLGSSHSGLGWWEDSKEIEVDISIFLDYSVLFWHKTDVKYSCDFVPVSIFSVEFYFIEVSKTLIAHCVVFSSYVTPCLASCAYWE